MNPDHSKKKSLTNSTGADATNYMSVAHDLRIDEQVEDNSLGARTLRKVAWRIIPFLCLLYIFNILDRSNVGFARLGMQEDLGMTKEVFDIGFGMFFVGYLLFEVPSNLLLQRFGARRWIARIMITWGLMSSATMFVTNVTGFYLIRVLLGIAEAGFFPGIILYLSFWFPDRQRARMIAYFMLAIALASVLGNPVSGSIMHYLDGHFGLHGWQWVFLLEGIPTVLLGVFVLFYLTDTPQQAKWLLDEERAWLVAELEREDHDRRIKHGAGHWTAMLDRRVWLLIAIYFTVAVGTNATSAYLPSLLKERFEGWNHLQIGLLSSLPHLAAIATMIVFSRSSDRLVERRLHVAAAALLAAIGWAMIAMTTQREIALIGLCLAQGGMMAMLPVFWAIPSTFLSGAAAAGGIALINSLANIGGFFGPIILGQYGLWPLAVIMLCGAALAMCIRREQIETNMKGTT